MKVKGKNIVFSENNEHHWFYLPKWGWIRLTDGQLWKAREICRNNQEDTPKISWFRKLLINIVGV